MRQRKKKAADAPAAAYPFDFGSAPVRGAHGYVLDLHGQPTDPCGRFLYALGPIGRQACFDFAVLPNGQIVLHVAARGPQGNSLGDLAYRIVEPSEAVAVAEYLWGLAWHWTYQTAIQRPLGRRSEESFFADIKATVRAYGLNKFKRIGAAASPVHQLPEPAAAFRALNDGAAYTLQSLKPEK